MSDTNFIRLCSKQPLRVIREAAKSVTDFNMTDKNGFTPLYAALNNANVVAFLIKKGADVNYIRPGGYSPLFCGYKSGEYKKILILFLNAGFNPNVTNHNNDTLLSIFTQASNITLCRILFKYSNVPIDLDIMNRFGETVPSIIMNSKSPALQKLLSRHIKTEIHD